METRMKMKPENEQVRRAARAAGMPMWKLAEMLGVSEATLVRWMRKPFSPETKKRALAAIKEFEKGDA